MNRTVLIIEDDPLNLKLITDLLEMDGCTVIQAADGDLAEELVRIHTPDLVMTDIRLPGRSGLDITRSLKSNPNTTHIPVILTTAFYQYGNRETCMESGCDDYLAKPFTINHLYEVISRYLPQRQIAVGH